MKKIIWLLMLIIIADPLMGEVTAWVNKNPVMVGELFQLQVEAKNVDDPVEPDLEVIRGLEILNRSVQNKTSIVGTSFTSTVSWTYVLIASASGEYLIPPLKVGKEKTSPILLKAVESSNKSNSRHQMAEVEYDAKTDAYKVTKKGEIFNVQSRDIKLIKTEGEVSDTRFQRLPFGSIMMRNITMGPEYNRAMEDLFMK